ncbi:hypothetical protein BON85_22995 [Escherichia coli]|nr:hypothetical protein BON85_22995 [Escherichia coli]
MINLIDVDGGFLNIRLDARHFVALFLKALCHNESGNDSNLLIVFYVQIMPDDFVMQLHRF